MRPPQLRSRYTRLPEFVNLARKLDPQGKFRNHFLERYIFA
jgi:alditol oxidase